MPKDYSKMSEEEITQLPLDEYEKALKSRPKRKMLGVKEAAEIMGISTHKIYELIRTEKISKFPHTRIGSRIIIPRDRLYEYLGMRPDETAMSAPFEKSKQPDFIDQYMSGQRKAKIKHLLHQLVDAIFE